MPAGPSISRETHYSGDSENIIPELSEEEQNAAQESFSVFFKPTQLYIILDQMASRKPRFLTRCLDYKLKEKLKSRVQLSVSISSRHPDDGEQTPSITPLYILLARPVPTPNGETLRSSCYRFKRACKLTASNGAQTVDSPQARFILPDIDKLSTEFKSGSLAILLVHFAEMTNQPEIDLTKDHMVSPSYEGYCSMAETPVDFVHFSRENSPKINLGERAQIMPTVSLRACYMKLSSSGGVKCVSFDFPQDVEVAQVPITITAEELGAKDIPPLDLHSLNISTDKLPEVLRQRTGEVTFKYKYKYNNNMLHMEEVTEGYSCPFCSQKCASYKGLQCHLPASHDHFNYEFWGDAGYRVVIVTAKITTASSEIVGKVLTSREKAFFFCHRPMRRKKSERQNANPAGPLVSDSYIPGVSEPVDGELYSPTTALD